MKSTHQEDKAAPGIVQFPVSQMSQTTQVLSCEYTPDVVVVGSQSSQSLDISAGVPQGSDLGPTIFSCFINDLPSIIRSEVIRINHQNKRSLQHNTRDNFLAATVKIVVVFSQT
ncbi:uncharacterized protein LOC144494809 isoform X3 [Mustelus asterias]